MIRVFRKAASHCAPGHQRGYWLGVFGRLRIIGLRHCFQLDKPLAQFCDLLFKKRSALPGSSALDLDCLKFLAQISQLRGNQGVLLLLLRQLLSNVQGRRASASRCRRAPALLRPLLRRKSQGSID